MILARVAAGKNTRNVVERTSHYRIFANMAVQWTARAESLWKIVLSTTNGTSTKRPVEALAAHDFVVMFFCSTLEFNF